MFANAQLTGTDLGFPDVCKTPMPAPVPVPYPNIALAPMAVKAVYKVIFGGGPAHNLSTVIPMSNGDNAGVAGGVSSGMVMGSSRAVTGANTVLLGSMPATRLTSVTLQNGTNCPGLRVSPSQTKVIILAP